MAFSTETTTPRSQTLTLIWRGSGTLIEATAEADARALLTGDPFAKVGLFSASEVKPWRRTFGATL
jgi:uncharacterized protein YciI